MAQVPYSPVPDQAGRAAPLSPVRIDTGGDAAFGGAVARGLGNLGQAEDRAADEIFTRANAMQQLDNEARARDAQAKNIMAQTDALNKFQTLLGPNASPEALKEFQKNAEATRAGFRDGLSSPAAQKIFDAESINLSARMNVAAASHSASQLRGYAKATHAAVQDNLASTALTAQSDNEFKLAASDMHASLLSSLRDDGIPEDSPVAQSMLTKGMSRLYSNRIEGIARTDAARAKALYDDGMTKGLLKGDDISKLQRLIDTQTLTQGPKNIADGIHDGSSLLLGQRSAPIDRAATAIKAVESSGGDYNAQGPVVASGQYKGQRALGAYQIMPGNLPQWLREAGMQQMSPEQFLANRGAQDQLFQFKFGQLLQKYGNFNDAASAWHSGRSLADARASGSRDQNLSTVDYVTRANASLAKATPIGEKVEVARRVASEAAPTLGNAMPDAAEREVVNRQFRDERIERDQRTQDRLSIDQAIAARPEGTPVPATLSEFREAHPELKDAIDRADPIQLGKVLHQAQRQDNTVTDERTRNANRLSGMALNDPSGFRDLDLSDENVTSNDRKVLQRKQGDILKSGMSDPTTVNQVKWAQPQLRDARILDDKESYQTFTGALGNEIQDFKTANGRAPKREEVETMTRRLLLDATTKPGFWGRLTGGSSDKLYRVEAPEEEAAAIRAQSRRQLSDEEVNALYRRHQYNLITRKEQSVAR